jgi:hypothetical protein
LLLHCRSADGWQKQWKSGTDTLNLEPLLHQLEIKKRKFIGHDCLLMVIYYNLRFSWRSRDKCKDFMNTF